MTFFLVMGSEKQNKRQIKLQIKLNKAVINYQNRFFFKTEKKS